MIYIKPDLFTALDAGGVEAVQAALQQAIELEHATIPPYLYALYSLDEKKNGEIAKIIQSVVIEEMLHMTLACNILNALDGTPEIDNPAFIPHYPCKLPGTVQDGLEVPLAPFSLWLVRDVFMVIEEPEDPNEYPVRDKLARDGVKHSITIGQFYEKIKKKICELGDKPFCDAEPPRRQIGPDQMDEAVIVTDVKSASKAIDIIIDQGEGTAQSPEEIYGDDVAHYYRFAEIYYGKKLIKNPKFKPCDSAEPQYIYGGEPIKFDPRVVYPVPYNPKRKDYAIDSAARRAFDTFNYTYTNLLKTLHATFNGHPTKLNAAIGLMMSLKLQAKDMMSGINPKGKYVGPSFEYQPVNPPNEK